MTPTMISSYVNGYIYIHLYGIGFSYEDDITNGFDRKSIVIFSDNLYNNPVGLRG